MDRRVIFRNPSFNKQTLSIKVSITSAEGNIKITDLILQSGTTGTGWVPNVTEMPWTTGVVAP